MIRGAMKLPPLWLAARLASNNATESKQSCMATQEDMDEG